MFILLDLQPLAQKQLKPLDNSVSVSEETWRGSVRWKIYWNPVKERSKVG